MTAARPESDSTPRRGGPSAGRATIHDIAHAAGVATSTVSRALSGNRGVSDSTRARVSTVADRLGYRPSRWARSLHSARTQTLGLLVPDLANPIAHTHLQGAVRAAHALGYTVFVCDGQGSGEIQSAELRRLLEYRVDGVLFGRGTFAATDELLALLTSGVLTEPEIALEAGDEDLPATLDHDRERADLEQGAAMAAYRRILSLGHRRVAYFTRKTGSYMGEVRARTFRQTMTSAGIAEADLLFRTVDSVDDAAPEVQLLLAGHPRATAIVVAGGLLTPHVLRGLYQSSLRIPDDISVVTFGDSDWHASYNPPISVIRFDYAEAAMRGIRRLVRRIEGRHDEPEIPSPPSEFVARGSVGPVPEEPSV